MKELRSISASRLKTFLQCPYLYYRRYILNERDAKSVHLVLGTAIHDTIQHYYDSDNYNAGLKVGMHYFSADVAANKKARYNAMSHFRLKWYTLLAENNLPQDAKMLAVGEAIIDKFDFNKRIPHEREKEFRIPFPTYDPFFLMHGFIDAVGDTWFADYKTNTRKPAKKTLDHDPQFIFYYWAYKTLYGVEPTAIWYHLRTGEELIADVGGEEKINTVLEAVKNLIKLDEEGMQGKNVYMPTPSSCKYCPYGCKLMGTKG